MQFYDEKMQLLHSQWEQINTRLMHNKEEFKKFLAFSAKMYKMPYSDAVLVYNQNPHIEKCCDVKTWNKLNRYVKPGEHGITVFGEKNKCRYLFDISQTNGEREPQIWELKNDIAESVLQQINEKSNKKYKDFEEVISDYSAQPVRDNFSLVEEIMDNNELTLEQGERYYNSLISVSKFITARRCEFNGDLKFSDDIDLSAVNDFKNIFEFIEFCQFAQKSAKQSVLKLEYDIVDVINKKKEEILNEQNRRGLREQRVYLSGNGRGILSSQHSIYGRPGGTGTTGEPDRQMGQNVDEVDRSGIPIREDKTGSTMPVADNSERDRYRSGEEMGRTGRGIPSEQPTSYDISGNTEMGERTSADIRASGNGGSGVQEEVQHPERKRAVEKTTTEQLTNKSQDLSNENNPDFYYAQNKEKSFSQQVDDVLNGTLPFYTNLKVCDTPQILLDVGCEQLPMLYTQKHLKNALKTNNKKEHFHGLTIEQIKKMPDLLNNPVMVYDSLSRNDSIIAVTSEFDKNNNPIIISIKPNGNGRYQLETIESNFITSIHGREHFINQMKKAMEQNKMLFCDKQKSQEMFERWGLQLSELTKSLDFNIIIHQSRNIVKTSDEKNTEKLPENSEKTNLEFHFGNSDIDDEWFSESALISDFAKENSNVSFALANAVFEYLDEKQHTERNIPELKAGWYKKTNFTIHAVIDGKEYNYEGRFDIGDGKGTGGGSLIDHIRDYNQELLNHTQYPFNQPEYKERAQYTLDVVIPFLQDNSELTAEEQKIFENFKAINPIKNMPEAEETIDNSQTKRTADDIKIGDRYLLSDGWDDKEVTVTSMRGIYPDDVGITEIKDGGKFTLTKNISKYKLQDEGQYLGNINDRNFEMSEEEQKIFENFKAINPIKNMPEAEETIDNSQTEIPTVSQFKNETGKQISLFDSPAEKVEENVSEKPETPHEPQPEINRLMGRLKMDCDYYLKTGAEKHLWAGTVEKQIEKINELFDKMPENNYFTRETIDEYSDKMMAIKTGAVEKPIPYVIPYVTPEQQKVDETTNDNLILKVREKYSDYYNLLCENGNNLPGYDNAISLGDKFIEENPTFMNSFNALRHDIVSSDREVAALAYALADNGIIEKFAEIEKQEEKSEMENNPLKKDYHYTDNQFISGAKSRFNANVEAIETLLKVEKEQRPATNDEQAIMSKYAGWGGIPQAFDKNNSSWSNEYSRLKNLLSEKEYQAASRSTLSSFYTPPEVIDGVYQALEQFGFKGGNVLEPSMGVGNFFGKMPLDMWENSNLYGVELDSISGRISKALYPKANIQIKGFEQTRFNNNSFDVVIGNVPFGDYSVSDRAYDKYGFKIHDYFAAKSVEQVKPGGIVAIVTSKFTMDKQNSKAREYLAQRCDLLGAVRLPSGTFKDADNVTTDILFLKKRYSMTVEIPEWVHVGETEDGIPCNQYYINHPEMVLGTMTWDERMKGKFGEDSKLTVCIPDNSLSFSEQLKNAVSKIKGSIDTIEVNKTDDENVAEVISADPTVRNFTYTLIGDDLYFRENEVMTKVTETGKTLERMKGLHEIRLATMGIIDAQVDNCSDSELERLQKNLNSVYDKFVEKFGYITDSENAKCFKADDDYNTLAALEIVDIENKTVNKAEIFSKRTIKSEQKITTVDNADEALQVSLDRLGKVDIRYMAGIAGVSCDEIIKDLTEKGSIFRNPVKADENDKYSGYEEASEYLSGNVRRKLRLAESYAASDDSYKMNVEALKPVIPKDLEASEISVRIGANWIDIEDYNSFLTEYAHADMINHPVYRKTNGEYTIEKKYRDKSISAQETYGTQRMNSYDIFEHLLNQREIKIKDYYKDEEGKTKSEINSKETQLAKEKARKMSEGFVNWLWKDIDRREKYVQRYNEMFNAIKCREYDGSHQSFPGMNPYIKLRPHQENAVMRGKLGGNTLLAHCVGAGKSFEMIAITMEKRRLGLINKACVVVPKHLTLQTASEWLRLYPKSRLLVATPEDFDTDKRQRFIARCVTGEYDAVIMSYQQFEKLPMSDEYRKQFMENEISELARSIEENDDRVSVKTLEKQKVKLEEKLKQLLDSPKDNSLCFEKLGFDFLVVDEAHNYKNCFVSTKMSRVAGIQTSAAQKSEDMFMKTEYLNNKYGCNNIVFCTGTPVSNSMTELYIMQRYLRPDLLRDAGVAMFDDWASTFGEVVTQLEMNPAGNGYRMKSRFSKFVNIPELMQMYKEFADIQTADMIKLPTPKIKTGKPIVITAKPDENQKAYMKVLTARAEAYHNGLVKNTEDNMVKITGEARDLGLDARCIDLNAPANPEGKVAKLLDNLEKIYHETAEEKGVQIVFCDIAIKDKDKDKKERFSVYKEIKKELIKRGIPKNEICFAGDAKTDKKRADMFEELRKGKKRFIIASTSKLGTGANIQDRICAIHHLDIPWRPSDITQQNGRGIRQGNRFDEVGIYHYLTEETFDAYMMGIITNKAKFINQIMTSKNPVRSAGDVDETVLTYSEMQAVASGNPLIMEKIQLDNDVATLKTLKAEHTKSVFKLQELAEKTLPAAIENNTKLLEKAKADFKCFNENKPKEFVMEIDGTFCDERKKAGEKIEQAILRCSATKESIKVGKYSGFDISIEENPVNTSFFEHGSPCIAVLQGKLKYSAEVDLNNNVGNIRRIENLASIQIGEKVKTISEKIAKDTEDLKEAKENMNKPFEQEKELNEKIKRLEVVNMELSEKTVTSEMYEDKNGQMIEIIKNDKHSAVCKNINDGTFAVMEEPFINGNNIEYRNQKEFSDEKQAREYQTSLEKSLSEKEKTMTPTETYSQNNSINENKYSEIGKHIDDILVNSKVPNSSHRYDITGAKKEIAQEFSESEINACVAFSLLCRKNNVSDTALVEKARNYAIENGIDISDLSPEKSPCKCHINLLSAYAMKLEIKQPQQNKTIHGELLEENSNKNGLKM